MDDTLYQEIGGKDAVKKASHYLYVNILKNDRLKSFFEDVDIGKQERKMNAFLTYIFGGPSLYLGKDMRRAHKKAVEKGLNDDDFDAMLGCLRKTLHELNIGEAQIEKVINVTEKHRDDVLNK